jgi:osmotically inducible protein OsmC
MTTRTADAKWMGSLKEGNGTMRLGSGAFEGAYSFPSRFEAGKGTNPEELIGAAHAGCFSMALSSILGNDGIVPDEIRTTASVKLGLTDAGMSIIEIALVTRGKVPGLDAAGFKSYAEKAKTGCIVSRALAGVGKITLDADLG